MVAQSFTNAGKVKTNFTNARVDNYKHMVHICDLTNIRFLHYDTDRQQKVSQCDQEIKESHIADHHMAS